MSLNLRVSVPAQNTVKVMRFAENMSVHEATKIVQEKVNVGGKDHGLMQPAHESDPTSMGRWMKPDRTLEYYDLKQNDTIVYRKKTDTIKVKLVDDTVKTILADTSIPVVELVDVIAKKVGLKNPGEFSLQEDGKGVWLKNNQALVEQVSTLDQIFLLKKKFFVNDANINTDDPVELHLVFCQSRDDIVAGNHPCTKEEAVNFAALHCQIIHGSFNPNLHKPDFLNLKEILPPAFRNKDNEKKILEEWKKLVSMTEVNARYRYVQLCRSLKTYGMTCFKVREKVKDKKKLMDAVLCFTRDSILRMEYETKRVIKEHPFKHLMRWAASPETFTMDFGAYEEEYIVVVTTEGEAISNLIAGYIDLLLKKQKDTGIVIDDDQDEVADVSNVARVAAMATTSMTTSNVGAAKIPSFSQGITDVYAATSALERMKNELFAAEMSATEGGMLTPEQRRGQVAEHAKALANLTETMETLAKGGNKNAMNAAALKMVQLSEQLAVSARQAAAASNDPNDLMLVETAQSICDALKNLLSTANTYSNNPNDPAAKEALIRAQQAAQAALQRLGAIARGAVVDDEGFKQLFKDMARAVEMEAQELLGKAIKAENAVQDPTKRDQLHMAGQDLGRASDQMARIVELLAPTAKDSVCKLTLERTGKAVESSANFLVATAKASGVDPKGIQNLMDSQKRIGQALANLIGITELPELKGAEQADEFTNAAQALLQSAAALMASEGKPELIKQQAALLKNAVARLGGAGKGIITSQSDPLARERLANYLKGVVEGAKKVLTTAQSAAAAPNDKSVHKLLKEAVTEISDATQQLLADSGRPIAIAALYNSAKMAAATSTQLVTASRVALNGQISDSNTQQQLNDAVASSQAAIEKLLQALKEAVPQESRAQRRSVLRGKSATVLSVSSPSNTDLLTACDQFVPVGLKLVAQAKGASSKVTSPEAKQNLVYTSDNNQKAIQTMLEQRRALKGLKGQLEAAEAMEALKGVLSDIDAALASADTGILQKGKPRDQALAAVIESLEELGKRSKNVEAAAVNAPDELGNAMKSLVDTMQKSAYCTASLAASLDDKISQKALLNTSRQMAQSVKQLIQISRALGSNPTDANLNGLLGDAGKAVADALNKLRSAANGIVPTQIEDHFKNTSNDFEDLAEKELQGAADVIEKCVAKLSAATQAARERMVAKQVDIDEQNITEAILESCQAIAKSTGVLVGAATAVQQDYQKLVREPAAAKTSYKRDPQWAQGLISAARTVAGAVQHLVKAANSASQGNASEEALIVAAQTVSAATTQLVTASAVKSANINTGNQSRLTDAAKKVSQATSSLVNAAKAAAAWEDEQQKNETEEGFNLTDTKVKEMEQQMAILRLEKELEKARTHLATMRKNDYKDTVNPEFSSKTSAPAPSTTTSSPNRVPPASNAQAQPSRPQRSASGAAPAPTPTPASTPGSSNVNWKSKPPTSTTKPTVSTTGYMKR